MLTERDLKAIDDNWTEACHAVNRRNDGQPFNVEAIVQSATDVPLLYDMVRDLQGRLEDREAKIEALQEKVEALQGVISQHDLCHDMHGEVDARAFANGCTFEQRKIYGCAPDADEVIRLRAALERIACRDQGEVGPHMEEPRSAVIAREVLGQ